MGRKVSASTHNQAPSVLLFLYRDVLGRSLRTMVGLTRLGWVRRLMAALLYGSGLRGLEMGAAAPAGSGPAAEAQGVGGSKAMPANGNRPVLRDPVLAISKRNVRGRHRIQSASQRTRVISRRVVP